LKITDSNQLCFIDLPPPNLRHLPPPLNHQMMPPGFRMLPPHLMPPRPPGYPYPLPVSVLTVTKV